MMDFFTQRHLVLSPQTVTRARRSRHVDADSTPDTDETYRNRDEKEERDDDAVCGGAAG